MRWKIYRLMTDDHRSPLPWKWENDVQIHHQPVGAETIKETIDGQEVDTYRVSGISIPNSYAGANIGKGFCFSSAYIEELKEAGVKSVQIRYKTDGNAILYRGYLYSQADWTSKGWQAVAADWATMTTWESDSTISIDDLEKTHINFAYNGATATYIQLYLVLNY